MNTKYLAATSILIVNDPRTARDFYVNKLGFEVSFEWGEPLTYLGVKRNDVEIHLTSASNAQHEAGKAVISIFTDEVDDLYEYFKGNGVETTVEPGDREYGLRDFGVRDPDGNIINFGCDVS
ncbi:MAG TPA: VOC family protein [Gammaproteobacteria bacterium]